MAQASNPVRIREERQYGSISRARPHLGIFSSEVQNHMAVQNKEQGRRSNGRMTLQKAGTRFSTTLFCAFLMLAAPASAQVRSVISQGPADAPAVLQACHIRPGWGNSTVDLFDRFNRTLAHATLHFVFYDDAGRYLSQQDVTLVNLKISPGQVGHVVDSSLPSSQSGSTLCKLTYAEFVGPVEWRLGSPWHGRVYYTSPNLGPGGGGSYDNSPHSSATQQSGSTQVLAVWPTVIGNDVYLHVRYRFLVRNDVTIRADEFRASFNLANGGILNVNGQDQAAPLVPRGGEGVFAALGEATDNVPSVDSSEDLGALGSLMLPAGRPVTVVVTFHPTQPLSTTRPLQTVYLPPGLPGYTAPSNAPSAAARHSGHSPRDNSQSRAVIASASVVGTRKVNSGTIAACNNRKRLLKTVLRARTVVHDDGGNVPSIVRSPWQQQEYQVRARLVSVGRWLKSAALSS